MRPRSAAILACRIIALFFGIQAVIQAVSLLAFSGGALGGTGAFWALVGTTFVVAIFLWVAAENISQGMIRGAPDEPSGASHRLVNAHAVAFSIVGVVLIVQAIPSLIATGIAEVGGSGGAGGFFGFGGEPFFDRDSAIVANVVRIVLGFILIFGAGDISRSLARRYPEPDPPVSP